MLLTEIAKTAGIVGAGGAGFPTHVKLQAKADWFIVNAAECEPLIETDKFLCRTFPHELVSAIIMTAEHLGAKHAVIALKEKYRQEITALQSAIDAANAKIQIFPMAAFYPAGDEQTIVQLVTGKTIPERGLPLDVGAVVNNVGTLLNLYHAVTNNTPVYEKYLSVTGEVKTPVMLHVPIGTPVTQCIAAASPTVSDYVVISGGPMMGKMLRSPTEIDGAVVTKTTGNLLVLPREHFLAAHNSVPIQRLAAQARAACIQCRLCTDLCPRYLIGHQIRPHLVMRNLYLESAVSREDTYIKYFGDAVNCCSCGVCELFSCPMKLSPRRVNDYMKGQLRKRGVQVPKNSDCHAHSHIDFRRVPTERLISRLGLSKYSGEHALDCIELHPAAVYIPFSQHIGKPAVPIKREGDFIKAGELLAEADSSGLSVNIHGSIDGIITKIDSAGAEISVEKEG